jgi:hypothetical protein
MPWPFHCTNHATPHSPRMKVGLARRQHQAHPVWWESEERSPMHQQSQKEHLAFTSTTVEPLQASSMTQRTKPR